MATIHNENSRVKIPALVHFTRLGYTYRSLKDTEGQYDEDTNIFIGSFRMFALFKIGIMIPTTILRTSHSKKVLAL